MRLGEICHALDGRLLGDATLEIRGAGSLEGAGAGDLTFLTHRRHLPRARHTRAAALVCGDGVAADHAHELPCPVIAVADPLRATAVAVGLLQQVPARAPGVHPRAHVDPDAELGEGVAVMPFAYVGRARIGARTRIFPHTFIDDDVEVGADCEVRPGCVLMYGTRLGDRVLLQPGVALGGDGFGFAADGARHVRIPQVGRVVIEDDVELGSLCAVDRGSFDATRIGRGTKTDNLVQIGHNCDIGEDVILVSQVGIAGSTTVRDRAVLAGKVGVNDHVTIGAGARVGAFSAVASDIPDNGAWSGIPAMPHGQWLRTVVHTKNSDKTAKEVRDLRARVARLEAHLERFPT